MAYTKDDIIPLKDFGRDHWSTFAYIDTLIVELQGFQIGFDGRMRQGRRNFRVMKEMCSHPKRVNSASMGIVMDLKYGTRLRDGSTVEGHDDWDCVQDLVEAGLLVGECEPSEILKLSENGKYAINALREHKRSEGSYATFEVVTA